MKPPGSSKTHYSMDTYRIKSKSRESPVPQHQGHKPLLFTLEPGVGHRGGKHIRLTLRFTSSFNLKTSKLPPCESILVERGRRASGCEISIIVLSDWARETHKVYKTVRVDAKPRSIIIILCEHAAPLKVGQSNHVAGCWVGSTAMTNSVSEVTKVKRK